MKKIEINLDGPQGNAFYILGCADELGKQLNFSVKKRTKIYEEMTSGDYENLLERFEHYFQDLVYIYSDNR